MSVEIKDFQVYSKLFNLDKNKLSFPNKFSFSDHITNKISKLESNPTILAILINTSSYLLDDNTFIENDKQTNLDSIISIIVKIILDNKTNKVYESINIYLFNQNFEFICNKNTFSQEFLEKEIKQRIKKFKGSNIINAFNDLLVHIDSEYFNYFKSNSRISKFY